MDAHPAAADSIPTSANQEDHVSMGAISARHARTVLRHVEQIVAIELLCATQALDLRLERVEGARPGAGVGAAHELVRSRIPRLEADREPGPDLTAAIDIVRSGVLAGLADPAAGPA
jgi:histidine ammonia-lyase